MFTHNYYKASLFEIIRYLYAVASCRLQGKQYFIKRGLGLERRRTECGSSWQPYISFSNQQQKKFLQEITAQKIAQQDVRFDALTILGAGRLYDLNLWQLGQHFQNIELVDADYLCVPAWRREVKRLAGTKVQRTFRGANPDGTSKTESYTTTGANYLFTIEEITGLFSTWTIEIRNIIKHYTHCGRVKETEFAELTKSLSAYFSQFLELAGETKHLGHFLCNANHQHSKRVVFSQNILSQLGTFWFGILLQELEQVASRDLLAQNEHLLAELHTLTNRILYTKHFADLNSTVAEYILLTTDLDICRYWLQSNDTAQGETIITWSDEHNNWRSPKPHLIKQVEHASILECLNTESNSSTSNAQTDYSAFFAKYLPNYKLESFDSTSWHVKPPRLEGMDYGIINRVGFFSLRRVP